MDISVALDAVGGEFNAFTTKEYTVFHARVLDEDLGTAVDVLGDMVTASTITAADVEAERDVILDEIAMHDDDPDDVVHNLFAHQAWGDTPLGRPIAGTDASITAMTRAQIHRFYRRHYRPDNMVVVGRRQHRPRRPSYARCGRRSVAAASSTARPTRPRSTQSERARKVHPGEARTVRPQEQVNLVLGVKGLTRTDPRRYALGVLNTALGGGTSSRMFQEVRELRGLAYSVYSFASHHADAGVVGRLGRLPARQVRRRARDRAQRARQGRGRGPHRRGGRARQGPAQGRPRARPGGLRLADVAHRQGRARPRRAAHDRRGGRPHRGRHRSRTSPRSPGSSSPSPSCSRSWGPTKS